MKKSIIKFSDFYKKKNSHEINIPNVNFLEKIEIPYLSKKSQTIFKIVTFKYLPNLLKKEKIEMDNMNNSPLVRFASERFEKHIKLLKYLHNVFLPAYQEAIEEIGNNTNANSNSN